MRSLRSLMSFILIVILFTSVESCGNFFAAPGRTVPDRAMRELVPHAPDTYAADAGRLQFFAPSEDLRRTLTTALSNDARATSREEPSFNCIASLATEVFMEDGTMPAEALRRWIAWKCGATSTHFALQSWYYSEPNARQSLDFELARNARKLIPRGLPSAYGIARRTGWKQGHIVGQSIVIATRHVQTNAVAKQYAPGALFTMAARPLTDIGEPVFYIDLEGGGAKAHQAERQPDGTLIVSTRLPKTPGRYLVELWATEPSAEAADPENPWGKTILLFPLYVGVSEESRPGPSITRPATNPSSSIWARMASAAYNAERERGGHQPLAVDARLMALAQRRSEDIARSDRPLPPDRTLPAQLAAEGVPSGAIWQSQQEVEFLSDLIATQLEKPSLRARLVGSGNVSVGIGVAPRPAAQRGRQAYAVVEYWVTR